MYVEALTKLARLQSNQAVRQRLASAPAMNQYSLPEMNAWLMRAGHSESDLCRLRCVHVAGSKGKGTVCNYTSSLLQAWKRARNESDPVGMYTSPHVVSVRERIALDGQPISQADFARFFGEVYDAIEKSYDSGVGPHEIAPNGDLLATTQAMPGFFTFMTVLAFHVFLRLGVHDAVVECGIGGEFDPTNILPPGAVSAAVITSISDEHKDLLGGNIQSIAHHKAGIIKPNTPVVTYSGTAGLPPRTGVRAILRDRWTAMGGDTTYVELTNDMVDGWVKRDFSKAGWNKPGTDAVNKALAVTAALMHTDSPIEPRNPLMRLPSWVTQDVLRIQRVALRGRREIVRRGTKIWVLDGAHTEHSLSRIGEYFRENFRRKDNVLVFNQQDAGRPLEELLKAVIKHPRFNLAVCTRNEIESGDGRDLTQQMQASEFLARAGIPVHVTKSTTEAVELVEALAGEKANVLVTGSFHLVGSVLQVIKGEEEEL